MATPRNELKFYVSEASSFLLERRLSAVLRKDSHIFGGTSYAIRSLYFDDPTSDAYFDKINGLEKREKYRIRFYNQKLDYMRLEKKAKIGNVSVKSGIRLSPPAVTDLLEGKTVCSDSPLLTEFNRKIRHEGYRPLLFVDYSRTAFVYPAGNIRITLDRNLSATRFGGDLLQIFGSVPCLEAGRVILEVKFDSVFPPHLSALLEDVPKEHCAISKFCICHDILF